MRRSIVCGLLAASAIAGATDKPNGGRTVPSGTWRGICADGSVDWGDPMPIEITFRAGHAGLSATGTIDFQNDDRTHRKARATLTGKKIGRQFVLRGTMTEVDDGTEWDIELQVAFDGHRLTGKFVELVEPTSLMCSFSWTKSRAQRAAPRIDRPPTEPRGR